uniref:Uncharacterized protein n=1 Tax=Amphimedon queenslandica TaxID=400682 RepID=A0A1X7UEX3_AMPQE
MIIKTHFTKITISTVTHKSTRYIFTCATISTKSSYKNKKGAETETDLIKNELTIFTFIFIRITISSNKPRGTSTLIAITSYVACTINTWIRMT